MGIGIHTVGPGDPMTAMNRRIAALEQLVREMAASRTLENAEIRQGGIQITNGGSLRVVDADGNVVAVIGALPAQYNRADGTPQPGIIFNRPNGQPSLLLGDRNATTPPYNAAFQVIDALGRIVVSDDVNGGRGGLATPHVVCNSLQDTNVATWPATVNPGWTSIADGLIEIQNPRLQWSITLQADVGTTGNFRLMINGTQMGTTQTVDSGFLYWQPPPVAMPAGISVGDIVQVELDGQRTAGTGTVRAVCRWITGMQS